MSSLTPIRIEAKVVPGEHPAAPGGLRQINTLVSRRLAAD
jgi:hypothetical protein